MSTTAIASKESALSYQYIRRLRFLLWSLGAWPGHALGECEELSLPYRCFMKFPVISNAIYVSGEFHYFYENAKDMSFTLLGLCIATTFFGLITVVRSWVTNLKKYGEVLAKFFMSFHLINFKHHGDYYAKMHETVHKLSYYVSMYSLSIIIVTTIFFNISPIYSNHKNGAYTGYKENATSQCAFYFSFPGFSPNDWCISVTPIYCFFVYLCVGLVNGLDLLLYLIVFQIVGHILILKNSLKEFPTPQKQDKMRILINKSEIIVTSAMFDEEENAIVHHKLVECIEHHKFIVSFTNDVSEAFGPVLAASYGMHLMSCCILLLECTNGDTETIISFVPITVNIFAELILISCVFEVIGTVSEQLKDSVYETPWECMNTKNRRTVLIFLQRVQTPIIVSALEIFPIGVVAMSKILKTTFSYFAFLKSLD